MIVINPNGGLGNQMFFYAVGVYLSEQNNCSLKVDVAAINTNSDRTLKFEKFIQRPLKRVNSLEKEFFFKKGFRFLRKILNIDEPLLVNEKSNWWEYPEILDEKSNNIFINGVFPFSRIIEPIFETLKDKIRLSQIYYKQSFEHYLHIIEQTNSVAIHFRKKDYLNEYYSTIFHSLPISYYKSAMADIEEKIENVKYFIFSDDVAFAKANIQAENVYFISGQNDLQDYHEFELMRNCKSHILANSTFSWWAAKLSDNDKGIKIMPKNWYILEGPQKAYANGEMLYLSSAHKL